MAFQLSTGSIANPSASATVINNVATSTIRIEASCYLGNGWVYSTGVVARVYVAGALIGEETILGNATAYYYATEGTKTVVVESGAIPETIEPQSVEWSVEFWQYTEGWVNFKGETISGAATIPVLDSYAVTYNANGGTGVMADQQQFHGIAVQTRDNAFVRTGYTFTSWGTTPDEAGDIYAAGGEYSGNAPVTLYARWAPNAYTLTLNASGGALDTSTCMVLYDRAVSRAPVPVRTNYDFAGWYTAISGGTQVFDAYGMPTTAAGWWNDGRWAYASDVSLHAQWVQRYVPPTLAAVDVDRCNANGEAGADGEWALVTARWACDYALNSATCSTVTVAIVGVLSETFEAGISEEIISADGFASGSLSAVVGGTLDADTAYTVAVTVADTTAFSPNTTTKTLVLEPCAYVLDFLRGGTGAAFGKPATTSDVLDVAWNVKAPAAEFGSTETGTLTAASVDVAGAVDAAGYFVNGQPFAPPAYTLPPATTTTLGGVKSDGATVSIAADGTLSALAAGGGLELLWTNPSPTAAFAAQTISNASTGATDAWTADAGFIFYLIVHVLGTDWVGARDCFLLPVGNAGIVGFVNPGGGAGGWQQIVKRQILSSSATQVQFDVGRYSTAQYSTVSTNNAVLMPYQIFGIK